MSDSAPGAGDDAAPADRSAPRHFIQQAIDADLAEGVYDRVQTRFPPEPNGYLHIGHAKSICLQFALAEEYEGVCKLRFDDTNPAAESSEYTEAIERDVRWLGFDFEVCYASDYFEQLHAWAIKLIEDGKAFVCSVPAEQTAEMRTLNEPGTPSPDRDRSIEENLELFRKMTAGEVPEGELVLRARIDTDPPVSHPSFTMRDPVMYRVLHHAHHRTGDRWCVYPNYDWAHGQSDAIEGVTHSLCTLEFANNQPIYNWYLDQLGIRGKQRPRQIEFAPLNIGYTVQSKRRLRRLVEAGDVDGWDDPRMPTLGGMRRRGIPPEAIRAFIARTGYTRVEGRIDPGWLEEEIRKQLNREAERRMAVLDPLEVEITNYPADQEERLPAVNNPEDEGAGKREVPFSRTIYIERSDFMEEPPRKFHRLGPDREVRLRYAYYVTCKRVIKDDDGNVVKLECTYDPATRGGDSPDGRKVKGTIHWVSAKHAADAEVRLYDRLFSVEDPAREAGKSDPTFDNLRALLNPDSLQVKTGCKLEPSLAAADLPERVQFERTGYFVRESTEPLVFNRITSLRDGWAKKAQGQQGKGKQGKGKGKQGKGKQGKD